MKITFHGTPEECFAEMLRVVLACDVPVRNLVEPVSRDAGDFDKSLDEYEVGAERVEVAPAPEPEAAKPEPKKPSKRKGPAEKAAEPEPAEEVEAAVETSDITDADLAKAASHAAGKITPAVVKEILAEFGVDNVQQLGSEVRQQFLDDLRELDK
jgi:hypothetical protein